MAQFAEHTPAPEHEGHHAIGLAYPSVQLTKALTAVEREREAGRGGQGHADAEARAAARVQRWLRVLHGIASGSTHVGSRTPVERLPAWVTLEIEAGGFATGEAVAGGRLRAHERDIVAHLSQKGEGNASRHRSGRDIGRQAINSYHLSDEGLQTMNANVSTGAYRITVPEEAALPVVAWLLARVDDATAGAAAARLIIELQPFLSELRFTPKPLAADEDARLAPSVDANVVDTLPVALGTVASARRALGEVRVRPQVAAMHAAIKVWAPFLDDMLSLWLQVLPDGGPLLDTFGADWLQAAAELIDRFDALEAVHGMGVRKRDRNSTLRVLLTAVNIAARTGSLGAGLRRQVQCRVSETVAAHDRPSSQTHVARRARQAFTVRRPMAPAHAAAVSARINALPADRGISLAAIEALLQPIGAPGDAAPVPRTVARAVRASAEAPLSELVAAGLVPSGELLARLAPEPTAVCLATAYPDASLARLLAAHHVAFARRRSLLLLNLESQVRVTELPWVAAVANYAEPARAAASAAAALRRIASLALSAYPATPLPNSLVTQLTALARAAAAAEAPPNGTAPEHAPLKLQRPLPLVKELAADIFEHAFSRQYLAAVRIAANLLAGSVYERYYQIDYAAVRCLEPPPEGCSAVPELYELCKRRAKAHILRVNSFCSYGVAWSGAIIEQAQILTTHNLAALVAAGAVPDGGWRAAALAAFRGVCSEATAARASSHMHSKQAAKRAAFAWRQLIFYVALLEDTNEQMATLDDMEAPLGRSGGRNARARLALRSCVAGLREAVGGQAPAERPLLGWAVGYTHPLVA